VQAANLDLSIALLHEEAAAMDASALAEQEQADDA
jgi:hypothetical protein